MHLLKRLVVFAVFVSAAILGTNGGTAARAADYTFSRVYSTSQQLFGAAINDNGLVALINENSTLMTTNGLTSTIIASPPFTPGMATLNWPTFPAVQQVLSLNNSGYVSFRGTMANGTQGVIASNGATTNLIANYSFSYGGAQYTVNRVPTSINDNGVVAFEAGQFSPYRVFLGDGKGSITRLNDHYASDPAINSSGVVAYNTYDGATEGVEIQNGAQSLTFPGIGNVLSMPSLNDNGVTAFYATVGGVPKIVVGDGISSTKFTDLGSYPLVSSYGIGNGYIFDGYW